MAKAKGTGTTKGRKRKSSVKAAAIKPPVKHNLGQLLDGVWSRIPPDHQLWKAEPLKMPSPHESLQAFGREIIAICEHHLDRSLEVTLRGDDLATWERLVGAWALRQRSDRITRCVAAKKLGMDRSNLTIALNGKRPVTHWVLISLAKLLNVEPFDIRPDCGATYARNMERGMAIKFNRVSTGVASLKADIENLISEGMPLHGLLQKVDRMDGDLRVN